MKYVFLSYLEREDAMNPFIYFNKQNQNWSIVIKEVDENNFQITYQTIHGFQTKADAEDLFNAKMEQFEKDMAKIKKIAGVEFTLSTYLEYWFKNSFSKRTTSTGYLEAVEWTIYKIIIPCIEKDQFLPNITPIYINQLLKKCNQLSYKTSAYMAKKILSIAIKQAVSENRITRFDIKELDSYPETPPKYIQYSKENLQILLEAAKKSYVNYLEILLCLLSGLRIGEVRGLNYSNVDFDKSTITVCQQIVDDTKLFLNGHKTTVKDYVKPPKSSASYRTLCVPPIIMTELAERKKQNEYFFKTHPEADTKWKNYVCIGVGGQIKNSNTTSGALKRICRSMGLPVISPHGLRHMCATIMLESGIPLETISHALGHSSVSTTYDIYCGEMDGRDNIRDFLNEKMDPVNYYTK